MEMIKANKYSILVVGVLCLLLVHYLLNPFKMEVKALQVVSIGLGMIVLWISERIPMPVVSLIPLVAFPLVGIETMAETSKHYSDPIIFLFMGGFFIALAIEKWNLHQRIALNILHWSGSNGNQILLGFMLSTFMISMWLSNTATTMMMFPIAVSVIQVMEKTTKPEHMKKFTISVMLSIAYASNIGGLSTIIGTPPNTAYVGFMNNQLQAGISFFQWFVICFPIAVIILFLTYLLFSQFLFRNGIQKNVQTEKYIYDQLKALGPWSKAEKRVFGIFLCTAFLWITKDLIVDGIKLPINDSMIALCAAFFLFSVPSGKTASERFLEEIDEETAGSGSSLLVWSDTRKMAWGILLLFGGGLALAKAMENTGIMKMIGDSISNGAPSNLFLLIFLVTAVSIFLSEVMSNIAQVIVMAPILTSIATTLGYSPILLGLPMTLAASCAGMLPMGTPPNAIAFSSGKIPIREMIKAGFLLNLLCILCISVICYFLGKYVFDVHVPVIH